MCVCVCLLSNHRNLDLEGTLERNLVTFSNFRKISVPRLFDFLHFWLLGNWLAMNKYPRRISQLQT